MEYKREPLTREERRKLERACEGWREKVVVWTLLDTGLRLGEFVGIRYDRIDWQDRKMVVWGKARVRKDCRMCKGTGKLADGARCPACGKRRIVPLTERLIGMFGQIFSSEEKLGYGMSRRTVERIVSRVARKAGIRRKVSPHVLRHTFAVHTLQKGVSLATLQRLLGHGNLSTTQLYLNMSGDEAVREFREKVEGRKDEKE